jgi:predicted RNA methylase
LAIPLSAINFQIHQLMLKDSARNRAYRQAIFDNADQIRGRTVLDVGAGTGILSVLCAQAGAAKVYAVEASSVWRLAQEVISENRFDNVVEVSRVGLSPVMLILSQIGLIYVIKRN